MRTNSKVDIPLPDDDHVAFTIMMDIIHDRGKLVPKDIPIKLLSFVTVLVDKYLLHDVVDVFADVWMEHIEQRLTSPTAVETVYGISNSWVFSHAKLFQHYTGDLEKCVSEVKANHARYIVEKKNIPLPFRLLGTLSLLHKNHTRS